MLEKDCIAVGDSGDDSERKNQTVERASIFLERPG